MKRIKAFLEKWQHRLQGHMLMTWIEGGANGEICHTWVRDIYTSDNGKWFADTVDGETLTLHFLNDYTITGA